MPAVVLPPKLNPLDGVPKVGAGAAAAPPLNSPPLVFDAPKRPADGLSKLTKERT